MECDERHDIQGHKLMWCKDMMGKCNKCYIAWERAGKGDDEGL